MDSRRDMAGFVVNSQSHTRFKSRGYGQFGEHWQATSRETQLPEYASPYCRDSMLLSYYDVVDFLPLPLPRPLPLALAFSSFLLLSSG